jgi:hypothetical protein
MKETSILSKALWSVRFVLLSALIHAGVLALFFLFWDGERFRRGSRDPVEIVSASDLPVVQTLEPNEQAPNPQDPRYSGEKDQRVEREMRAPITGKLRRGGPETGPLDDRGGKSPGPQLSELLPGMSPNQLAADIPVGNSTLLNTDAVLHASFLNRVSDEIYGSWVHKVREAADRIRATGGKLSENLYVTKLAIEMDDDGKVVSIEMLKSCGIDSIDQAPKSAFWESDPFPNPPSLLRQKDGGFRFVYEFHFEYKSSSFNILPWSI